MVEAFGVPHRHFQTQRLAEQGLPGAELLRRARVTLGIGIVQQHLCQAGRPAQFIHPRIGRLDQHGVTGPLGAEIKGVSAPGVIHIDVAAIQKQSLTLFCVAEGRVAAFFRAVIGFGLDDPGAEPQVAHSMANDFAQ
ncbi:hypothetical protein D9M71_730540 [compost metagenome]